MTWIFVLILAGLTAHGKNTKAPEEKSKGKIKAPAITLQYSGGTKEFHSLKVIIAPFSKHLEYKTTSGQYIRDCKVGEKRPLHWTCKSPCSGGELKMMFESGQGFDIVRVPAFKIQPSHCTPNSSPKDPWIKSKKDLKFQIKKLGTK